MRVYARHDVYDRATIRLAWEEAATPTRSTILFGCAEVYRLNLNILSLSLLQSLTADL